MKAYDSNQVWVCSECGVELMLDWSEPGIATHRSFRPVGTNKKIKCPHAGKRFKLPMVELEEVTSSSISKQ
jgi:hypothetical protein